MSDLVTGCEYFVAKYLPLSLPFHCYNMQTSPQNRAVLEQNMSLSNSGRFCKSLHKIFTVLICIKHVPKCFLFDVYEYIESNALSKGAFSDHNEAQVNREADLHKFLSE